MLISQYIRFNCQFIVELLDFLQFNIVGYVIFSKTTTTSANTQQPTNTIQY